MYDLYYYRARYYDPNSGRFISSDPIEFMAGDFNFYRYVGNNPVDFRDAFGYAKSEECKEDKRKKRKEKIKKTKSSGGRKAFTKALKIAHNGVRTVRTIDMATPEPSDIVPWKWIGYLVEEVVVSGAIYLLEDADILGDKELADAEKLEKKCDEEDKKEKDDKARNGEKIEGIEHCGKVMSYCKAQQKTFSKQGDKIRYDADHIPSKEYMLKKATDAVLNGDYEDAGIKKMNDCIKQAITCNAKTIVVPQPIHAMGFTYGRGVTTLEKLGDFDKSANDVAKRDIKTYRDVLKKEDAINKRGKKLTKKDKAKLKKSNDKCEKQIESGLKKMEKEDYDKFLDEQIKANKECDPSVTYNQKKPSCPREKCK